MVKVYQRSFAGDITDPSTVRSPPVLVKTVRFGRGGGVSLRAVTAAHLSLRPHSPCAPLLQVTHLLDEILDTDAPVLGTGQPRLDPRFVDEATGATAPTLLDIQSYLWDRLRSVCKDLKSQNYRDGGRNDAWAQETLERIVRVHVLFNYECTAHASWLSGAAWQQNEEQVRGDVVQRLGGRAAR